MKNQTENISERISKVETLIIVLKEDLEEIKKREENMALKSDLEELKTLLKDNAKDLKTLNGYVNKGKGAGFALVILGAVVSFIFTSFSDALDLLLK